MSLDAVGTFAVDTRLRHHRGHVLMYRGGAPGSVRSSSPSSAQSLRRDLYAKAVQRWRLLNSNQRHYWALRAAQSGGSLTGWNVFLACVLSGGSCGSGDYSPPPLSDPVSLNFPYSMPVLSEPLLLAEV